MRTASTLSALALASTAAAQPTVPWTTTGWADFGTTDVTSVVGNFLPGWTTIQGSPDLGDDVFGLPNESLSGINDDAALWFLEFSTPLGNEIAELSLSGFTPGESYSLEFFATILQHTSAGWTANTGELDVTLTGASISTWSSTTLTDAIDGDAFNVWVPQTLGFTAVSSTVTFQFNDAPATSLNTVARFGIDGMRLIPAPASAALLSFAGLAAAQRRRSVL